MSATKVFLSVSLCFCSTGPRKYSKDGFERDRVPPTLWKKILEVYNSIKDYPDGKNCTNMEETMHGSAMFPFNQVPSSSN